MYIIPSDLVRYDLSYFDKETSRYHEYDHNGRELWQIQFPFMNISCYFPIITIITGVQAVNDYARRHNAGRNRFREKKSAIVEQQTSF
jgi:hypothetical protein